MKVSKYFDSIFKIIQQIRIQSSTPSLREKCPNKYGPEKLRIWTLFKQCIIQSEVYSESSQTSTIERFAKIVIDF